MMECERTNDRERTMNDRCVWGGRGGEGERVTAVVTRCTLAIALDVRASTL